MRISDWSSDVCSSDLSAPGHPGRDVRESAIPAPWRARSGATRHRARGRSARTPRHLHCVSRRAGARPMNRARACGDHRVCRPCRSEEHTSELQSLMRISYAGFCLKKKKKTTTRTSKEKKQMDAQQNKDNIKKQAEHNKTKR